MHLSDGVLEWPVLMASSTLAAVGIARGLRRLPVDRLPSAAVLAAIFFVGGTLHVPLGVGSVHLVLSGLLGLLLGWAVFPVLLVGLVLQATLLSFGGVTVIGANLLILGLPAAVTGVWLRPRLATLSVYSRATIDPDASARDHVQGSTRALWLGVIASTLSLSGSMVLAALMLWLSGGERWGSLIVLISVAHLPALVVDGVITGLTLSVLMRFAPEVTQTLLPQDTGT